MSFNSCKDLGSDMTLGDVVAKTITCDSIIIENPDNEDLTAETITATEKLLVSNNAMVINNTTT